MGKACSGVPSLPFVKGCPGENQILQLADFQPTLSPFRVLSGVSVPKSLTERTKLSLRSKLLTGHQCLHSTASPPRSCKSKAGKPFSAALLLDTEYKVKLEFGQGDKD